MKVSDIPDGWRLVPIEPTAEMLSAANKASLSMEVLFDDKRFSCERACYAAAIAHAPEPRTILDKLAENGVDQ